MERIENEVSKPNVRMIFFAQIFWHTAFSVTFNPVLPLLLRGASLSVGEVGVVSMFGFLGWAFFEPTLGMLSDKIGRKKIVITSLSISILVVVFFTFFQDFRWFCFVNFAYSACSAGYLAPSRALIADITPAASRGKNYGILLSSHAIGHALGPFIGAYLAQNYNYNFPFYFASVTTAITALLVVHFYPKDETLKDEVKTTEPGARNILTVRLLIFIASRALPMFLMFYMSILTIVLNESPKFNATEEILGLMVTSAAIVTAVTQYLSGALLDKIGSAKFTIMGFALESVTYCGFVIANNLLQIWLLLLFLTCLFLFIMLV